jgi:hypothetical protein
MQCITGLFLYGRVKTVKPSTKEKPMDEIVEERLDERLTEQCDEAFFDDDIDADDGFEL